MAQVDGPSWSAGALIDRLGAARAIELRSELEPVGLAVVDAEVLGQLQRQAAAYQRLAALVDDPDGR